MPNEQSTHNDKDVQGRRTRSPIHLTQRSSDAAQRASRLLDVSPPAFGMSGLTSDSDFAPPQHHAPVKRRDHRSNNAKAEEAPTSNCTNRFYAALTINIWRARQ